MPAKALRAMLLAAIVFPAALPAAAEQDPPQCRLPVQEGHPLADRQGTLAQFERLPQPCLKELFRQCTDAAGDTLLDLGSAAACSIGYEALLRQGFGGNFQALMAWWRSERSQTALN